MVNGNLSPEDARQMAAFVLGVGVDAGDEDALTAFRRLSSMHHPNNGGEPEVYGAVLGAWSTWVRTSSAVSRTPVIDEVVEELVGELVEVIDQASVVRASALVQDGSIEEDALASEELLEQRVIALPELDLPAPHRAYALTGDRRTLDPMRTATVSTWA